MESCRGDPELSDIGLVDSPIWDGYKKPLILIVKD